MKKILIALFVVLAAMIVVYGVADAKVSGECVNCHTMHNSQDGAPMAVANGSWDGGPLSGDAKEEPNAGLLRADCIGCHSSSVDEVIHTVGSTEVPIVRTTVAPSAYLAGGNFYYSDMNDAKGHNISTRDATLDHGPGVPADDHRVTCTVVDGLNVACHATLAYPVRSGVTITGCQGCHLTTFHHGEPGPYNATSTETDPTYRYLTGHHYFPSSHSDGNGYVEGVEDPDWEATTGGADHNYYKGASQAGFANSDLAWEHTREEHTISSFCSDCHYEFHATEGTGTGPWLRHPVDQELPSTGEFAGYSYSTETPVAWETLPTSQLAGDQSGPTIACVSCHRTHATQWDDMLRFDYTTMIADGGGSGGCFNCHSAKN